MYRKIQIKILFSVRQTNEQYIGHTQQLLSTGQNVAVKIVSRSKSAKGLVMWTVMHMGGEWETKHSIDRLFFYDICSFSELTLLKLTWCVTTEKMKLYTIFKFALFGLWIRTNEDTAYLSFVNQHQLFVQISISKENNLTVKNRYFFITTLWILYEHIW